MVKVDNSFIINLQNVPAAFKNNLKLSPDRSIQDPIKMMCRRISETILCTIDFGFITF